MRRALRAFLSVAAGAALACDAGSPAAPACGECNGEAITEPAKADSAPPDAQCAQSGSCTELAGDADANRKNCKYERGAPTTETVAPSARIGMDMPIDHIVVLVQENHSFDEYLGQLARYDKDRGIVPAPDGKIEVPPAGASNPTYPADQPPPDGGLPSLDAGPLGRTYQPAPSAGDAGKQLCIFDPNHTWYANHFEYDNGLNDGFFGASDGRGNDGESTAGIAPALLTGDRALFWYDEGDIPLMYALASKFAIADHYHSEVLAPTFPNRLYLYAATSFGEVGNYAPTLPAYSKSSPALLFDELVTANVSWALYAEPAPDGGALNPAAPVVLNLGGSQNPTLAGRYGISPIKSYEQFVSDAQNGTLPSVAFVDADFDEDSTNDDDEHPPGEIEIGQQYIWRIVNAVTHSTSWKDTVVFITYDDPGGTYDHVPPPHACVPDDIAPIFYLSCPDGTFCGNEACVACGAVVPPMSDQLEPGQFDRYGFRVPFIAISPYSKKSYVSHRLYSHSSIVRFIEARFGLGALTRRDANADPFTDLFDWNSPPFMQPPSFTEPTINQSLVNWCRANLLSPPVMGWVRGGGESTGLDVWQTWQGRRTRYY